MIGIDDWKCDQFRWFQNAMKDIPASNPLYKKRYYLNVTPEGKSSKFVRHSYVPLDKKENFVLIHYMGNSSTAVQFSHGNCKNKDTKPYIRTCPSVLNAMKKTTDSPANVYKNLVSKPSCSSDLQPVLAPRNVKQVHNAQASQRQEFRLSHDALYNLHEMAYDTSGFVRKIETYPDLVVICALQKVMDELNRIIQAQLDIPILLSYDTTFSLGDIYVSPLLFRHVLFDSSPVVPAAFLLHERKFESAHEIFMSMIKKGLPSLMNLKSPIPIVTDDEQGVCNAIDKTLVGVTHVKCWNHILNSAKLWLRRHGAKSAEIPVYISNLRELFHQQSYQDYLTKLDAIKVNWSLAFLEYFEKNIHFEVCRYHIYVRMHAQLHMCS